VRPILFCLTVATVVASASFRYVPTTINGCPVASLAQEPLTFKIQRW
jgi:hypothetical protein